MRTVKKELLLKYFVPANVNQRLCVDEREFRPESFGVRLPGASSYELDLLKKARKLTEYEARVAVARSGILGFHNDAHGARGCGYNRLVEDDPQTVGASESVKALDRFAYGMGNGAFIVTCLGNHDPHLAIINNQTGMTFDTNRAWRDGLHAFNVDAWFGVVLARQYSLSRDKVVKHLITTYKRTVNRLAPETPFITIG